MFTYKTVTGKNSAESARELIKLNLCQTDLYTFTKLKKIIDFGAKVILQELDGIPIAIAIVSESDTSFKKAFPKGYAYVEYLCTSVKCKTERLKCGSHFIEYLKNRYSTLVLKTLETSLTFYLRHKFQHLYPHDEYYNDILFFTSSKPYK